MLFAVRCVYFAFRCLSVCVAVGGSLFDGRCAWSVVCSWLLCIALCDFALLFDCCALRVVRCVLRAVVSCMLLCVGVCWCCLVCGVLCFASGSLSVFVVCCLLFSVICCMPCVVERRVLCVTRCVL